MADVMESVADGIYRLGSALHNFYVIQENDRFTVIDAGCSRELSALVGALNRLGGSLEDVEGLLITHAHADHFGFAREAQNRGVELRIHENDVDRATGTFTGHSVSPGDLPWWKPGTIRFLFVLAKAGVMKMPSVDSIETMADGERIDVPGRPTVIHTPGHTAGHAMFHLEGSGVLFSGDGLITTNVLGRGDGPQMLPDVFHADRVQAYDSLDRVTYLRDTLVLPGHGGAWRGDLADAAAEVRRG